MKISDNDLKDICEHFGGAADGATKLLSKIEQFGIQTLAYLPTLLKKYQKCPLTFPDKRTPEGADSILFSLKDNATNNLVFKNNISLQKLFYDEMMWSFKKSGTDEWDTSFYKRKSKGVDLGGYSGHFSKPDDATLTLAAFFLRSNILVFDGDRNKVDFYDGNLLKQGNVVNTFPFLLGHSKKQYQALIPDDRDSVAYKKIRDYVIEIILNIHIREAEKRSKETISSKYKIY